MAPPRKLYRIGEVMQHSGLSRQTLHNYTVFGLISEAERTTGGHRLYEESVFERLEQIEALKRSRSLKEIRDLLREPAARLGGEAAPSTGGRDAGSKGAE